VRRSRALGDDRYVVFTRLAGNFPGGTADLANRFTLRDGLIAKLKILPWRPEKSLMPPRLHKGPSPSGPRTARIVERVRAIPKGFVRTYADIEPAAPRLVGHVLATTHENLPWHRVVRADGSAPMGASQLELLRREGVPLRGDRVDLSQARLPG
jgi:alkylated DNA nucleotide flippase Atl1